MSTTGVEFVHYQNGLFVTLIDSPAWRYDTMLPRGYLQLLRRPSSIYESCPETSTRNITRNLDRDNLAPRGQPMATCLYVFTCTCALEIFRFQLQSVDDIYISMYALVPVDSVSFWKFALAPFIPDHLGDNCAISPPLSKISYRWLNKRISARPPVPVSGLRPRPEPPWWRPMETAPGRSILLPTPPPPLLLASLLTAFFAMVARTHLETPGADPTIYESTLNHFDQKMRVGGSPPRSNLNIETRIMEEWGPEEEEG